MSSKGKSKSTTKGEPSTRVRHPSIDAIQSHSQFNVNPSSAAHSYSSSPSSTSSNQSVNKNHQPNHQSVHQSNHLSSHQPNLPSISHHTPPPLSSSFHSIPYPNLNLNLLNPPFLSSPTSHTFKSQSQIYHRHAAFPQHFASQSLKDLQALTSLVDSRSNWYEDSRISDSELDSITSRESRKRNNRSKSTAKELKNYYEKMNKILDGWREADEIVDSQFPAEVLKRFGDVDDEEIKRVAREVSNRNRIKFNSKKKKRRIDKLGKKGNSEVDGNASDDEGEDEDDEDDGYLDHRIQLGDDHAVDTTDDEGLVFGTKSKNSNNSSRRESFARTISGWFSPSSKGNDRNGFLNGQNNRNERGRKQSRDLEQGNEVFNSSNLSSRNVSPAATSSKFQKPSYGSTAATTTLNSHDNNNNDSENHGSNKKAGIVKSRDFSTGEINSFEHKGPTSSTDNELGSLDRELAKKRELKKEKERRKDEIINHHYQNQKGSGNGTNVPDAANDLSREEVNERGKNKSKERKSLLDVVPGQAEKQANAEKEAQFAININLVINILLLAGKAIAVLSSNSVSLIASLVDSALDLLSTVIIFATSKAISYRSHATMYKYPVGKRRLEPLGVVVFAVLMIASFCQVLVESISRLRLVLNPNPNEPIENSDLPLIGVIFMVATIGIKAFMWLSYRNSPSSGVRAVAQDSENDVVFNIASLIFPVVGAKLGWHWLDPLGGIVLSLYIIYEWLETLFETITKLSGAVGDPEDISRCLYLVTRFNAVKSVSAFELYHSGDDTIVEADVVLPHTIQLKDAHDFGEVVQYCTESLPTVERAYIHLDYNPLGQKGHLTTRG